MRPGGVTLRITATPARHGPAGIEPVSGSARTRGPFNLPKNTNDAIETAHAFPGATIVPVHYEGWAYFTQSGGGLVQSFAALGLGHRLRMLQHSVPTAIEPR